MTKSQIIIHIEVDFQINLWYNMHLSLGVSVKEKYNNSKIYRIKKHEKNTKITINQVLCVLICIESLICGFFIYKLATRRLVSSRDLMHCISDCSQQYCIMYFKVARRVDLKCPIKKEIIIM